MDKAINGLIKSILNSEVYENYAKELERIKKDPELKAKADEYRAKNYEIQTDKNVGFEQLERFERDYGSIRDNEVVSDFLAAELDLCRLIQEIQLKITEAMQFE